MNSEASTARTALERCDILGEISEEADCLARPFATKAMQRVNAIVAEWMQEAGMSVTRDAIGNLIGRYEGDSAVAKTLVLGSHLDSVRDAGRYDGPLGVMVAIACVQRAACARGAAAVRHRGCRLRGRRGHALLALVPGQQGHYRHVR